VRCVVLSGVGAAFCAGADLGSLRERSTETDEESRAALELSRQDYSAILNGLYGMSKPSIAALPGPAVGVGAGLALACDIRYGAPEASLSFPFVRLGLSPDGGSSWMLPRLIGRSRALELLLTGERLPAADAERLGVFNRVVPANQLESVVRLLANGIAGGPAEAIAATKQVVHDAELSTYGEAIRREFDVQAPLRRSADFQEGVAAALERRPPRFT
jgi:2-(1,2-epoxy-1,2-dihydrophenyl)acetyl-CoA isomerase